MEKTEIIIDRRPVGALSLFAAKAVMAGVVAVISAWIISEMFIAKIATLMDQRTAMIEQRIAAMTPSRIFDTGVLTIIRREVARNAASGSELAPEEKEKFISDLRTVADRWRPFFVEASSAIMGNSPPPAVPR